MSKIARCCVCDKLLGEIRDARLHKDIDYICKTCKEDLYSSMRDSKPLYGEYGKYSQYDFLNEIQKAIRDS